MSREIVFRGKSKRNGEWLYGDLLRNVEGTFAIVPPFEIDLHNHCERYEVDENTIGQFTGLFDKNGNEIYEGDIIGCHNLEIKHLIFYNENEGRFMAALNGDIENYFVGVCGLDNKRWNASKEVIGNIHDNPELLKGGEK